MKAVIFAAGEGKRMLPLTLEKPKPLLPVLGKPLIEYTLEAMPNDVEEVVIVVGYKEAMIREYLGTSHRGRLITYVRQEHLGGTAEALMLARTALGDEPFLVFCADDIYLRADIQKLLAHRYAILVTEVQDPQRFGVVELDDAGKVVSLIEKPEHPKSNLITTGVFLLDKNIFNYEAPPHQTGERYASEMVAGLAKDQPVYGVISERWIPVGYPDDIAEAEKVLQQG